VTPAALAAAPLATQAKIPQNRDGGRQLDHYRAARPISAHQFHPGAVLDHHRRTGPPRTHFKKVATLTSDYAPGNDAADLLQAEFHRRWW